jgi:hypothetical protein
MVDSSGSSAGIATEYSDHLPRANSGATSKPLQAFAVKLRSGLGLDLMEGGERMTFSTCDPVFPAISTTKTQ